MAKNMLSLHVKQLIDVAFAGNVLRASAFMGVSQRTLNSIYNGDIQNPRVETVSQVAKAFNTTEAWLLRGEGRPPGILSDPMALATAAEMKWGALAGTLPLAPEVEGKRLRAVARAWRAISRDLGAEFPTLPDRLRDVTRSIEALFREWIKHEGKQAVAAKLAANRAALLIAGYDAAISDYKKKSEDAQRVILNRLDDELARIEEQRVLELIKIAQRSPMPVERVAELAPVIAYKKRRRAARLEVARAHAKSKNRKRKS